MRENKNNISLALQDKNFISTADLACMKHDIDYALANRDPKKISESDKKLIKNLEEVSDLNKEVFNTKPSVLGIKFKQSLETAGLISKTQFAQKKIKDIPAPDKKLLKDVQAHLEIRGYGFGRPLRGTYNAFVRDYMEKNNMDSYRDAQKIIKDNNLYTRPKIPEIFSL